MENDERDNRDRPDRADDADAPRVDEPTELPGPPGTTWPEPRETGWPSADLRSDEAPPDEQRTEVHEPVASESLEAAPEPVERSWDAASPQHHEPPPSEVESFDEVPGGAPVDESRGEAHSVPATGVGESTQCPRCGTENRPGLAFCRNCGQRLVAAGVASTVTRPGTPEGTQACPRCGTHNRSGVAFCQNCGANLRGAATPGYVPPAVAAGELPAEEIEASRRRAVLGPIVLLIGAIGIVTAWLLPFVYGSGSLYERSFGTSDGYGIAFWNAYPDVAGTLADQAYFGFAAPAPILVALLALLAIGGFVRASPGPLQVVGLIVALLWSVGLAVLFVLVEVAGGAGGGLVDLLRELSPSGIIFLLASLIVVIGTLTRFGRS